MKGMKKRVLAFVLAFVMIIANVMSVTAVGPDEEKYIGFEVNGYGGTFGKQYWDGMQWISDGQREQEWSYLNVSDGSFRNAKLWTIETEPTKEGAKFEGWAKFTYQATDMGMLRIFEPKDGTTPYYTTDEMLDAKLPEQDVIYAAKWSDIPIEDYYQEYWVSFDNFGEGSNIYCSQAYWSEGSEEPDWVKKNEYFGESLIAGFSIEKQMGERYRFDGDPTREGATFEGWARFKIDDEGNSTFMPQSDDKPYFSTKEMFASVMPAYETRFVPKWSDIDIEDYFPEYFTTAMNANGGKVTWSYSWEGENGTETNEEEYSTATFGQTARKSVNQVLEEWDEAITGITKPGEILDSWTVYQADNIALVYYMDGDTIEKSDDKKLLIHNYTWTYDDGTKEHEYIYVEGYKLIADSVSTEQLLNSYKGANYYAVANWKKSVALVEDKEVTQTLSKETESIIEKIKKSDTNIKDVVSQDAVDAIGDMILNNIDKPVKTELTVCPVQETMVDKQEKASILAETEKVLGKDAKVQYLDIQVKLTVDDNKIGNILKLQEKINITIAIPDDMKAEGDKYVVLRNHNGKVDILDTKMTSGGYLTFETDRFSTYALAYVPATSGAAPATPAPASPNTGDASMIALYSMGCILTLAVVVWKRKEFFVK